MSSITNVHGQLHSEQLFLHALQALPPGEAPAMESHLAECVECRREMETLRTTVDAFVAWPTDVLRPPASLWGRLARRVAAVTGGRPAAAPAQRWIEPEWKDVAPGISCKLLATDARRHRVSMLVRLAPGTDYPPHRHADIEELHLLQGELWIDGRRLYPGDYNRAEPGTADARVWSETGCTCVLMTSTQDELRG
jgi:anti-sigma factor ChrR (cupin superfamily)